MNLWLDDVRDCPFIGDWIVVKNYDQAIQALSQEKFEEAWLDHDLAYEHYGHVPEAQYEEKTGYDVVKWMEENAIWPTKRCTVHSMNPVGSQKMCKVIAKHYGGYPDDYYVSFMKLTGRTW